MAKQEVLNQKCDPSRRPSGSLNDEELLSAIKEDNPNAFVEIVERYQGLVLHYARHYGVPQAEESVWVTDLMHDVVLSLIKPGAIMPDSLGAYFARSCRNKSYMDHRARTRRQAREIEASSDVPESGAVVQTLCSETMLRDSLGPDVEVSDLPAGLLRLVNELQVLLTADERQLLDWAAESVPLRLIAEWTGVTRTAAAHRVSRLRKRLRTITPGIIERFNGVERNHVQRFLDRLNNQPTIDR